MPGEEISMELLERYKTVDQATLCSAVGRCMRGPFFMQGVQSYSMGSRMVARARTLRYMPMRTFLDSTGGLVTNLDVSGEDRPEYKAMGRCGPGDVLVCDYMGKTGIGIIGDVKTYYLKKRGAEGIITDGSIRDLKVVQSYGLKVFATGRTAGGVTGGIAQYEENVDIQCGGVLVRPGDLIVGDDDGVLVVPKEIAQECVEFAEEYDGAEEYIKELIDKEDVVPGKYYPPSEEFRARYRREKLGQP